jgi:CRISPR/Cas system-associated endonuclease Cas1
MEPPTIAEAMFSRDPTGAGVLVLDGFGLNISVSRGHLLLSDGLGRHRRERRLPRAQRTVRRIVILGHTGQITLEAVRWCADTGITLLQVDTDGPMLLCAGTAGPDDARLRRAQAAAAGSDVGVTLARTLLTQKIQAQARVAQTHLNQPQIVQTLQALADQLADADLGRVSYRAGSQMKMLRTMAPPRKITASLS